MTATMSIAGGVLNHGPGRVYGRLNNEAAPHGRKVYFLNNNGRDSELEEAQNIFFTGQVLTVEEIYVGGSNSEVKFIEYPDQKFNTVMFADLSSEQEVVDYTPKQKIFEVFLIDQQHPKVPARWQQFVNVLTNEAVRAEELIGMVMKESYLDSSGRMVMVFNQSVNGW